MLSKDIETVNAFVNWDITNPLAIAAWERIKKELSERRKTVRSKLPVQQRKGENEPSCVRCGNSKPCIFVRRGPSCRKWWAAHLSPVV